MSNILTVAYNVEGTTDMRFLESIIQRTFEEIAFTCEADIDVYPVTCIQSHQLGSAVENIVALAKEAFKTGIQVLCIHTDADSAGYDLALQQRINPGFNAVGNSDGDICKNLVAIIPVRMSEAWMLADKDVFKEEIGTTKSNADIGITRAPETIADPKQIIIDSIKTAQSGMPKKSRTLVIGDIYQPLGQTIPISALRSLTSYESFRNSVIQAFRNLNYLH